MATKISQKDLVAAFRKSLTDANFDVQQELSLCLSDMPKSHMSKAKNGKIYINITVAMRKEPDQWGRDLKVFVTPTKKDREEKANKIYVGGGKTYIFAGEDVQQPTDDDLTEILGEQPHDEKGDLPF